VDALTSLPPEVSSKLCLVIAAASHLAGILAERWLFFAEAKHVVALNYGFGERRPGDEARRERPVH
jgi:sulfite dehydrogenase (quinone) subunit SoeC